MFNSTQDAPLEVIKLVEVKGPSINDVHTEGEGVDPKADLERDDANCTGIN